MQVEIGSPGHVRRFPAVAVNCFTGSLAQLLTLRATPVQESRLLELGEGYLFRCGVDEWGFPEYTFAVQDVGLLGCERLGATLEVAAVDGDDWLDQLARLAGSNGGAVVWVNTSRLTHDTFYSENPAYLHALLVTGVCDDRRHIEIHDPLVVNRERYGCQAWVDAEAFHLALIDQVRTETYNHMGFAHSISAAPSSAGTVTAAGILSALRRQARRYFDDAGFHDAVDRYAAACTFSFAKDDAHRRAAARRLFDHINVLYVVPCLTLLGHSLQQVGVGQAALGHHGELVNHWRAMALLALKFEATSSPNVLERIADRFKAITQAERAMWEAIDRGVQASPSILDEPARVLS